MTTNYARGRQYEYRTMRYLEAAGYETFRTAGSHGVFDVGGMSISNLVLVQVKFNCNPTVSEIEQFRLYSAPPGTVKLIHRWKKGAREPLVTTV